MKIAVTGEPAKPKILPVSEIQSTTLSNHSKYAVS